MDLFEQNIVRLYGEKGRAWLSDWPKLAAAWAEEYGLSSLTPLKNLSYHLVLSGWQKELPIILKLGLDVAALKQEAAALQAFSGCGAVKILAVGEGMLLLEQAAPGTPLNAICSKEEAIRIACQAVKRLHQAPFPRIEVPPVFPHIKDWLLALDQDWPLPPHLLKKARALRESLLPKEGGKPILLHGDLHLGNILKHGQNWAVIDPKGVIGYPVNEVWAFIMDMEKDTAYVASSMSLELKSVREWYFVHLILASAWNIEDGAHNLFLKLAEKAYFLIT
ncbi:MAG: Streptomycin 6-kinase [Chlamydiales bacterium]|nr:Streptomycin 6-kinase [Chlamydiales bacterium]